MATYAPTLQVQAAFGSGALSSSPTWTTISTVQSGSIRRGRSSEFDYFPSGSATIQLIDPTRTFDPLNTSSSYAGSLLPNVPIRVRAFYSGGTYDRFYGYVDSWSVDPLRNTGIVTITATDAFKILAQKKLPQSVYETVVLDDSPRWYWRLGEASGNIAADSTGNDYDGVYPGDGYERGSNTVVPFGDGSAKSDATTVIVSDSADARITATPMTIEMWLQTDSEFPDPTGLGANSETYWLFRQGDPTTNGNRIHVFYTASEALTSHRIRVLAPVMSGNKAHTFDVTRLDDNRPHHIVIVIEATTVTLYIDGITYTDSSSAVATLNAGPALIELGHSTTEGIGEYKSWRGWIDDVAYYPSALSSTQVAAHRAAANSPWDGDLTGTRIGRVLDEIGWPAGLRSIDAGEVILGNADLDGASALSYLQLVTASEQGRLFMGAGGTLTFHGNARLRASTAVEVTFSDDGNDTPYLYGTPKYALDDRTIYNDASVQRKYGLAQTASNAASIGTYGPRTRSLSGLLMRTDAQSRRLAEQIVYRYKQPSTRFSTWSVNPQAKTSVWAANLGLELGDHIAFEIQTAGTLSRVSTALDLEQISESFDPSKYEFTYYGSPRDPNINNYATWGGTLSTQTWGTGVWA